MRYMLGITLIGMPGSGKSTVGRLLAERLRFDFLDLDTYIATKEQQTVGTIVKERGDTALADIEEKYALEVPLENTVFSPGGSIVYSTAAMERLKKDTTIVFLDVVFEEIRRRLDNIPERGIVGLRDKSLEELYRERLFLYRIFANITIDSSELNAEDTAIRCEKLLAQG
jgi:shikimate kinase